MHGDILLELQRLMVLAKVRRPPDPPMRSEWDHLRRAPLASRKAGAQPPPLLGPLDAPPKARGAPKTTEPRKRMVFVEVQVVHFKKHGCDIALLSISIPDSTLTLN